MIENFIWFLSGFTTGVAIAAIVAAHYVVRTLNAIKRDE